MRKIKFEVGDIYHIYNRGANRAVIFNNDSDMWRFLQGLFLFNDENSSSNILYRIERKNNGRINFLLLKDFIKNNQEGRNPLVRIMADCLMPNHFHLILQEIKEDGISRFMHRLGTGYTCYKNKKENRRGGGSLFQGPFKAVKIDSDEYLKYLLTYINVINPGQLIEPNLKEKGIKNIDGIISFAENYDWSTNKEYLGTRESIIVDKGLLGEIFSTSEEYKKFVKEVLLSKEYNKINHLILE